jgi:7-cyano-7-deazaguanine synthase
MKPKSIVLLSGGLDSTVSLKEAVKRTSVSLVLCFDYGQKAAKQEVRACRNICHHLKLPLQTIKLDWLKKISTTSLVNKDKKIPLPKDLGKAEAKKTAKLVWIPNRNGLFINIAAAFAESLGCQLIVTGFNLEEAKTFPDNSADFVRRINSTLQRSTMNRPKVISYTQAMTKEAIIRKGKANKSPLRFIWSCYFGNNKMCGKCESCQRLIRALKLTNSLDWFKRINAHAS